MTDERHDSWDSVDLAHTGHEGSAPMNLTGAGVASAWVLSLVVHTIVLAGMFLLVFPFSPNLADDEFPVANAQIIGEIDAIPNTRVDAPAPPPDPSEQSAAIDQVVPTFNPQTSIDDLIQPSEAKEAQLSIVGLSGGGTGAARFGVAAEGDLGPDFFGLGGSARGARTIVYVVDRSTSMGLAFDLVKQELKRSISALRRSQKFHVIFFASRAPIEFAPRRAVNAIDVYKNELFDWLTRLDTTKGGTQPAPALHRALSMNPDVVYFLTDAVGDSFNEALMEKLDAWNPDRHTRIFTIAYLQPETRRFLERIAREHGGESRFVSDDDLP